MDFRWLSWLYHVSIWIWSAGQLQCRFIPDLRASMEQWSPVWKSMEGPIWFTIVQLADRKSWSGCVWKNLPAGNFDGQMIDIDFYPWPFWGFCKVPMVPCFQTNPSTPEGQATRWPSELLSLPPEDVPNSQKFPNRAGKINGKPAHVACISWSKYNTLQKEYVVKNKPKSLFQHVSLRNKTLFIYFEATNALVLYNNTIWIHVPWWFWCVFCYQSRTNRPPVHRRYAWGITGKKNTKRHRQSHLTKR